MNIIEKYAVRIEHGLKDLPFKTEPTSLYNPCRYILENGGKRIRPILTLLGAGLCGGTADRALPAALSVELVHNFTLVHDDIMDQADTRRGRPSIHTKWNEATAILAGDELFVQACRILSEYISDPSFSKDQLKDLYTTFFDSIHRVCEGQALDMEFEQRKNLTTEDYLDMVRSKTAYLISASLCMGGITAGADEHQLKLLEEIGLSAGIAFQVQDDLLDVVADPEKFGKIKGGDVREGKKTFLTLLALEQCNTSDKNRLQYILESRSISDNELNEVIQLYQKYGVVDAAQEKMDVFYQSAINSLNKFGDSIYKQDLFQLLKFLKNREY